MAPTARKYKNVLKNRASFSGISFYTLPVLDTVPNGLIYKMYINSKLDSPRTKKPQSQPQPQSSKQNSKLKAPRNNMVSVVIFIGDANW
jgi:hypothetical protein